MNDEQAAWDEILADEPPWARRWFKAAWVFDRATLAVTLLAVRTTGSEWYYHVAGTQRVVSGEILHGSREEANEEARAFIGAEIERLRAAWDALAAAATPSIGGRP